MRLRQCILTNNDCYRALRTIQVKGIMVHSTGANNPKVARYVPGDDEIGRNLYNNHWNFSNAEWKAKYGQTLNKCVHAFIGKFADGKVGTVQTLPWNHRGWHAGGSANNTHIGFEICEDALTNTNYFKSVYQESVELTAMLCSQFNLDPLEDGVIICHSEGYARGIASNHADVLHWFPKHGKSMADFRQNVAERLISPAVYLQSSVLTTINYRTLQEVPSYYSEVISKVMSKEALIGNGKGEINVSEDLCRILTILDRLHKLD